ncbi:MAG: transcription termination factor NusA [Candidatus Komeilibacteria bacterium]|nr:transcription termination factor NusA [Candidatus Komeilibacteria bacterium]
MAEKSEIIQAIQQICEEKGISYEHVIETIEAALAAAFRKDFGEKNQNVKAEFDAETAHVRVFDVKTVVEDRDLEELEKQLEALRVRREVGEEISEDEEVERFNPKTDIMISEAKKIKKGIKVGEELVQELEIPSEFGRMAAQTAKQVIIQRLREVERETIFNQYKDKENTMVNGTVQRREGRMVMVDIGSTIAILPPEEQMQRENYNSGQRYRFLLKSVEMTNRGPQIVLSRSHPDMLRELFAMEVPEVSAGTVEIKGVSREAGMRSKVAVWTADDNIDPVGSCVGQRGTRVQTIIAELNGEKIDIIEWDEAPEKFIENALSPAKVKEIILDEKQKIALVKVSDDQLSLAIGKAGQNVRLAAKLTGWKIDIEGAEIPVVEGDEVGDLVKEESIETESNETEEPKKETKQDKKIKSEEEKK